MSKKTVLEKTFKSEETAIQIPFYHLELKRDYTIQYPKTHTMKEATDILHSLLDNSPVEQMMVLHMNSQLEIVGAERIAIGQLESVTAYMREVMRSAILASVPRIIISHNHPSGNPTASEADIGYTLAAMSAGSLMGIELIDHIVVAPGGKHYSIFQHKERLVEMSKRYQGAKQFEDLMNNLLPTQAVDRYIDRLLNGFAPLLNGTDD